MPPESADIGAARCLRARCPNGRRIEFAPSFEGPWAACPADGSAGTVAAPKGYVGNVSCPSADTFCTEDLFVSEADLSPDSGFSLSGGAIFAIIVAAIAAVVLVVGSILGPNVIAQWRARQSEAEGTSGYFEALKPNDAADAVSCAGADQEMGSV